MISKLALILVLFAFQIANAEESSTPSSDTTNFGEYLVENLKENIAYGLKVESEVRNKAVSEVLELADKLRELNPLEALRVAMIKAGGYR